MADSVTQILASGPPGTKKNIAVLGDGFAQADQDTYNSFVQSLLLDGVFGHDYFYEDKQAFNIFRVNLISADSGVSTRVYDEKGTPADSSDDTIVSTTQRNTALGFIFSGSWAHCWLDWGPNTSALITNALNTWVPDYHLIVIILNNPNYGGCGGGGMQVTPMGVSWHVMAHEFGHGAGGLGDEYCTSRAYSGGEPSAVNLTTNTDRATLKWAAFVAPSTPVPTGQGNCADWTSGAKPPDWNDQQDVGLFEGGNTYGTGAYRPVADCRMNSNTPEYCPVCYTEMKRQHDDFTGRTFLRCLPADFNGDGKDDLLIHNSNGLMAYVSNGAQFDLTFSVVNTVDGASEWAIKPQDVYLAGDFNGDGADEILAYNATEWGSTGYMGVMAHDGAGGLQLISRQDDVIGDWWLDPNDQYFVADFDGDGKDDLYAFNGLDYKIPYFAMLKSNGAGFSRLKRFDKNLPGWQMGKHDRFYTGDFNGDGKKEVMAFNGDDWASPCLAIFAPTSTGLRLIKKYARVLPGWQMAKHDQFLIGDFDGDGKDDLYVFNTQDWATVCVGMIRSTGSDLAAATSYAGAVPRWQLRRHDRFIPGDPNGDGKSDLIVFNADDWNTEYLGALISNGSGLSAVLQTDWVGEWNLGGSDKFEACDCQGAGQKLNLLAHNSDWLGLIGFNGSFELKKMYYRWIHNYHFGRNW